MKRLMYGLWFLAFIGLMSLVFVQILRTHSLERDVKAQYLEGGEINLQHEGLMFSSVALKGHPFMVYFGFTSCPDVCPVGLATIRDALSSDARLSSVKALFITLDPERDSPKTLKEYTQFFHPNIVGLTGTLDEIRQVATRYGTYFKKSERAVGNENEYTVDHTAYYYLLDQQGQLIRVLDHNVTAQEISELLLKLL